MGVLDKFLDAIKLNDDYDDDEFLDEDLDGADDDDDFLDDEEEARPKKKFFEKFTKKKSSDDEFDEFEDFDDAPAKSPVKAAAASKAAPAKQTEKADKPVRSTAPSSKITPMRSSRKGSQATNMEVCVIRPTSMEDTREIADTLVDNSTVILNLEGIDMELAQRIIDFTSGACYSLGGTLQKVSSYIFILGPYNVDITGDLQNILGGNSIPSVRAGY